MGDAPFDRVITNNLEKALSKDWNRALSQMDRSLRYFAKKLFGGSSGYLSNGLNVVQDNPVGMSVVVKEGLGFFNDVSDLVSDIGGVADLDDLESFKPIVLLSDHTFVVPTAPIAPDSRVDIIEVKVSRLAGDNESRKILDADTGTFSPTLVDKTLSFIVDGDTGTVNAPANSTAALSYKVGVAGNPPSEPATTSGYLRLANVTVGSGVTSIVTADILDQRNLIYQKTRTLDIARPIAITGGPASFVPSITGLDVDANEDVAFPLQLELGERVTRVDLVLDTTGQSAADTTAGVYRAPDDGTALVVAGNLVGEIASSAGSGLELLTIGDLNLDQKSLGGRQMLYVVLFNNSGSVDVAVLGGTYDVEIG